MLGCSNINRFVLHFGCLQRTPVTYLLALAAVPLVLLVVGVFAPVSVAVGVVAQERVVRITSGFRVGLKRGERKQLRLL